MGDGVRELCEKVAALAPKEWGMRIKKGDILVKRLPWNPDTCGILGHVETGPFGSETVRILEWLNANEPRFYWENDPADKTFDLKWFDGIIAQHYENKQASATDLATVALTGLLWHLEAVKGESQ